MEDNNLIVDLLKEALRAVKDNTEALHNLENKIVGQANCADFRKEFNTRLNKVEEVCRTYEATKGGIIDGVELQEAKSEAIAASEAKFDHKFTNHEERISSIEADRRLLWLTWHAVWDNQVLKYGSVAGGLALIGIYADPLRVFGWHFVAAILGAAMLLILSDWLRKRENRAGARKLLRL